MASNGSPDGSEPAPSTQLAVVGLAAVGLLVAAAAMPAAAPDPTPPNLFGGDCEIYLSEEPVAGQSVTATIRYRGDPAVGSPVWFNGEFVGRTDEDGRVTGDVPYRDRLRVEVRLPSGGRCSAGSPTDGGVAAPEGIGRASLAGLGGTGTIGSDAVAQTGDGGNGSRAYPVRGEIDIAVARQPYPGESSTIRATIDGEPVPDATVAVDREVVGRTDADGEATIRAPAEGDGDIRVRVARGDFESVRTVVVLRLDATVRSAGALPLPGQDGSVVATLGDRPAEGATVSVDGERLGETDENGTVGLQLPADPTTQVTVATADQATTVPAAVAFVPTAVVALVVLLVTAGLPATGYALGGGRGLAVGAALVPALYALGGLYYLFGPVIVLPLVVGGLTVGFPVGGYLLSGRRGFAIGALFVAALYSLAAANWLFGPTVVVGTLVVDLVVLGLVAVHLSPYSLAEVSDATVAGLGLLTQQLLTSLLGLSDRLLALFDDLRARSPADLVAWLAGLPAALSAVLAGLLSARGGLFGASDGQSETGPTTDNDADTPSDRPTPRARFRETWRRFANRVAPDEWPRRTAGEVSRRALERGLPREPVRELTETFRAVEYGDQSLTERQVERAQSALDAITDEEDRQ